MKHILTTLLLFASTALFAQRLTSTPKQKDNAAQSIKTIPNGKVFNLDKVDDTETTNKAILKGIEYKVYATSKGRLYIKLTSAKTGKQYRRYLKGEL